MTVELRMGQARPVESTARPTPYALPAHHLVTHAVVVGMTGSGKTGLVTVMVEEALGCEIPVLVIDVKGDLPNLLLAFPSFDPALVRPWAAASMAASEASAANAASSPRCAARTVSSIATSWPTAGAPAREIPDTYCDACNA